MTKPEPAPQTSWERAKITINGARLTRQQCTIVRLAIWDLARQVERGERVPAQGDWLAQIEAIDQLVRR